MIHTTPPQPAHLYEAINSALSCYDLKPDLEGLCARLPRQNGPLDFADIAPLLASIDLRVETEVCQNDTVQAVQAKGLPAIIAFDDGAVCAFLPTLGANGAFTPNMSASAAQRPARIIYILPPAASSQMHTEHMRFGHSLDWFWAPVRAFWRQYAEIVVTSVFTNSLMLTLPIYSMSVYDRLAVNFNQSTLFVLAVGATAAFVFDFLFKSTRAYILELVAAKTGARYDLDLMTRLMSIQAPDLALSVGERANLFRELQSIKDFYATRLVPSLVDLPFFFLYTGVIYLISPPVALVPVCAAVFILIINALLSVPTNMATQQSFASLQSKSTTLVQTLMGMETVRMLGAAGAQLFQWNLASQKAIDAARRNNMLAALNNNLCVMTTYLITVFVLFRAVYEVADGSLTTGGMVACSMLASRSIAPIAGLSGLLPRLRQTRNVLGAIDKIFALPHEDLGKLSLAQKGDIKGALTLHDVTYRYPEQSAPAINNLAISITPGEHIGLIGRTGAGKSTLARLITRQLRPDDGRITLDNYDLQGFSSEELHRKLSYIPQENFFFSGSIRANILMGLNDIDEGRLTEAVRASGLESILQSTGRTLDMDVGEQGCRLSGGQRQAMALARALVRDPRIVVFDEPMNGIDATLEAHIKQALSTYLRGRTFVMVTHRTSLLSLVDRLIMIDQGRIVADGPRDEVLAKLAGGPPRA